jgi:hypothetical protein
MDALLVILGLFVAVIFYSEWQQDVRIRGRLK